MKSFTAFTFFLFLIASAVAQDTGTLTGSVVSKTSGSAEGATVVLLRANDSVPVKRTMAGKDGQYKFESIAHGKYIIGVTAAGHQRSFSKVVELQQGQQSVTVPPLPLIPVNKELARVTVTGKRPLIEQKIDRTIVNVEAMVTNTGASALEVLENAPGVTVDKEGNISLKGKDGVQVLIDGRPSQLSGTDLANMLRNMNANQLDQVEIMTNPPARYDASGTAGIINIKTKKTVTAGSNGSATVTYMQGKYPKATESFNFNRRSNKLNLFTNLSHGYRSGFGKMLIQRNILSANTGALENYFDQVGDRMMDGNGFNGKLGLDFFASKRTTFGFVLNGSASNPEAHNTNVTSIYSPGKELEQVTNAIVNNDHRSKLFNGNLNFRTVLDKEGKELTSDFDFTIYDSRTNQFMVNSYFDEAGNALQKADTLLGNLPQEIKVYSGRVDYLHPLQKGARFEAGIKSSIVRTDNDAVYDSIENGNIIRDQGRSNHFVYEENINAAYANLSTSLSKKLSAQLGLRLENTNAKGRQLTTGEQFTRNYTQLFPTAYLQYKLDAKNTILVNYGRRVRRPGYQSLNPFIRFIDRYTYSKGNPNLAPQVSDNIELSHSWRNMITTTVNYSFTADIFDNVIEQKGQEAYSTPVNIASLRQYGLAVSANTPVTKWWTSNININLFNNKYEGPVNNTTVSLGATSFIVNTVQQFKLNKTLTAEINGRYRNGWFEGVVRARPVGFVGAGISQQMLKGKGTLRVLVRDIFYTQKFRGKSRYGNVDFNFQEANDSRVLSVGFTYRFSKGKKITPVKRTVGSANEEQERIGDEN
ncbi:MAG TPA: TonB-dependent receptor [Chitinophagaceae bacterium]|nr:TonB-dependent receptor [Chitinophagaceae bacterium]